MDAKVGDWVVTPRMGKPVEINALWYNALRIMSAFATRLGKPDSFSTAAKAVERSFVRFVRADGQGLYDVIDGPNGPDASVRPNQIFAVSLPHSPLSAEVQRRVVRIAADTWSQLSGCVRSSPVTPRIVRQYGGTVRERDGAITKDLSGAGCLDPLASLCIASTAMQKQRSLCWSGCATRSKIRASAL